MDSHKKTLFTPGSWPSIFLIFLYGVMGAATLSKLIPLGDDINQLFNTSATDFGFLIALTGIPAALLALPSGIVVDRFGPRAVLVTCALIGLGANLLYYVGGTLTLFYIARLIEGALIVFCYTAGPAYLMAGCDDSRRSTAMTVWSMYMPIGFTTGLFIGGTFAGGEHWRGAYLTQGLMYLALALLTLLQPRIGLRDPNRIETLMHKVKGMGQAYMKHGILLLGLTFFVMICVGMGANVTYPSYIANLHGIPLGQASNMVASVTLVMALGSLATGLLVARQWHPGKLFIACALIGIVFSVISFHPSVSLALRPFMIAGWLFVSGAATAGMMALLPMVAQPHERASGAALLNQAGAIASFVAPPLWLGQAAAGGWQPVAMLMTGGLLLAALMVAIIVRRA